MDVLWETTISNPPDPRLLREARTGLSGFGDRPSLHPAWREPPAPERGGVVELGAPSRQPAAMAPA